MMKEKAEEGRLWYLKHHRCAAPKANKKVTPLNTICRCSFVHKINLVRNLRALSKTMPPAKG